MTKHTIKTLNITLLTFLGLHCEALGDFSHVRCAASREEVLEAHTHQINMGIIVGAGAAQVAPLSATAETSVLSTRQQPTGPRGWHLAFFRSAARPIKRLHLQEGDVAPNHQRLGQSCKDIVTRSSDCHSSVRVSRGSACNTRFSHYCFLL